jgi:hypothetical protein
MLLPALSAGHVLEVGKMLSTPEKRFIWVRSDRLADVTFFRMLMQRRSRKSTRVVAAKERSASGKLKPAPWTPWLWMK